MLPLLPALQAILPYLLVFWLIPFLVIAVKMMRRPSASRADDVQFAKNRALFSPARHESFSIDSGMDTRLDDRPWTLEESAPFGGGHEVLSDSEKREAAWKLTSDVER
jgi:hypothetical protein